MAIRPLLRIVNESLGGPVRVIDPTTGNAIPNVRKVTWEAQNGKVAIATIEVLATIDVTAEGTLIVNPQAVPERHPVNHVVHVQGASGFDAFAASIAETVAAVDLEAARIHYGTSDKGASNDQ